MKIVAGALAASVMCGALVYYNFIDKGTVSGAEKGNKCPDFTAQTYRIDGESFSLSEETFTLSQKIGTVCVINFWETWCSACIQELPEFNRIQEEYGDEIEVVAALGTTSTVEVGADWLSKGGWRTLDPDHNWAEFSLTFANVTPEDSTRLGVSGMLPRTVIVDKSGIVVFAINGSITYEQLKAQVDSALE